MSKFLAVKGRIVGSRYVNESIADQVLNAADTYVNGSKIEVAGLLQPRASLRWVLAMTKTAAGVVAPLVNIRIGAAGLITDTARIIFNALPAQTAAADTAFLEVIAMVRDVDTSSILSAVASLKHDLENTGFALRPTPTQVVDSAGLDLTIEDLMIGLSIHPGAAGVWTVKSVIAELINT